MPTRPTDQSRITQGTRPVGLRARLHMAMLAASGICLSACGSSARQDPPPVVPDRIDRLGALEVVTHTHATRSANYGDWGQYQSWSLRWQGQPLEIASLAGMWLDKPVRQQEVHTAFVIGAADQPDLLVLVGDPNNAAVFHRVSQNGGQLATPLVCKTFGGDNAVRLMDGKEAGTRFGGPNYRTLTGTRHLLLGSACVYDTVTRRVATIPRLPDGLTVPYGATATVLSPDERFLARLVYVGNDNVEVAVAELDGQAWQRLPVDMARMRYARFEDVDDTWILHHFEWRRGADGHYHLQQRAHFKPLPWRGAFLAGSPQYDVPHVVGDQTEAFTDFLTRYPNARRLPDHQYQYSGQVERRFEIEQEMVVVMANGFYVQSTGKPYWPGKPGDPKLQKELIHRIGTAFDAELASGRHDNLFTGEAVRR